MAQVLNLGDRVECVQQHAHVRPGQLGTVVCLDYSDQRKGKSGQIGVRWDEKIVLGHDCGGKCENHHGYYLWFKELKLYEQDVGDLEDDV